MRLDSIIHDDTCQDAKGNSLFVIPWCELFNLVDIAISFAVAEFFFSLKNDRGKKVTWIFYLALIDIILLLSLLGLVRTFLYDFQIAVKCIKTIQTSFDILLKGSLGWFHLTLRIFYWMLCIEFNRFKHSVIPVVL